MTNQERAAELRKQAASDRYRSEKAALDYARKGWPSAGYMAKVHSDCAAEKEAQAAALSKPLEWSDNALPAKGLRPLGSK